MAGELPDEPVRPYRVWRGLRGRMLSIVQGASALGAGSVYVTPKSLPDPYSVLPKYWSQETAAAAAN